MKKLFISLAVVFAFFALSSFKGQFTMGSVSLEISSFSGHGGSATIQNTDTNVYYDITAVDTQGSIDVPYGNYIVASAGTPCSPPFIHQVTTSTGSMTFVIDADTPGFTIMANCY
ncbi:hypothetical protein VRU48_16495 [Pedobacter sp. KR3-3]|uniref:Uncharacterized protein n=1 Tax=Pedobacter albus TaxID=3113905 RepID=A0ABU7IB81_9SPHI|nr:hypothetical protein [Pedobacter sp. KR3-3]MEE1946726.1 hypothetical protein [Pedobacter sp. KR3-3]